MMNNYWFSSRKNRKHVKQSKKYIENYQFHSKIQKFWRKNGPNKNMEPEKYTQNGEDNIIGPSG